MSLSGTLSSLSFDHAEDLMSRTVRHVGSAVGAPLLSLTHQNAHFGEKIG